MKIRESVQNPLQDVPFESLTAEDVFEWDQGVYSVLKRPVKLETGGMVNVIAFRDMHLALFPADYRVTPLPNACLVKHFVEPS